MVAESYRQWNFGIDKEAITILFGGFSIISAKLEFSRIWNKNTFFGAEIQWRIVLKFEIFPLSSFRDMVIQSRSGLTLFKSANDGSNQPPAFRPQNLAEF